VHRRHQEEFVELHNNNEPTILTRIGNVKNGFRIIVVHGSNQSAEQAFDAHLLQISRT